MDILNRDKENKPQRVPVSGLRDIMTVFNKDPAYSYRWVTDANESGSRIMRFMRGGWDFARVDSKDGKGDVTVGAENVYKSEQKGSIVRQMSGGGDYSYLMRIPVELFEEDKAAKAADIQEVEDTITGTGSSDGSDFGQYGDVSIKNR